MPLMEDLYAKQRARQVEIMPFFYSAPFTAGVGAAPASVTAAIPINSDSHFVARYLNITTFTGAANTLVVTALTPALTIQFLDTSTGRTLFDNAQPITNVCGGFGAIGAYGSLPFIFPEPWLIRAGGSVQVTITNLGAVATTRMDVVFPGFKVFKFGASSPADL